MNDAVAPDSQPEAVAQPEGEAAAAAAVPVQTPNSPANVENDQDRNWRQLRGDRDYWRDRAALLERGQPQPRQEQEQVPAEPQGLKTLADFEYDEAKYQQHLFEQSERRAEELVDRRLRERADHEADFRRKSQFNERQKAFAKDNPDYHAAIRNPAFTQSDALIAEIMESEDGPAIAQYLANNLDITHRLNALPPVAVAREIVRIETKLQAEREKAKAARNQIPAGNQPAPAPKLEGAGDGSGASVKADSPDSDSLSDAEWVRRRNAQVKARANRK